MKKFIYAAATCLMALSLIACRPSAFADCTSTDTAPAAVSVEEDAIDCVASAKGYELEVVSVAKGIAADGADALIVTYRFTNNGSVPTAFWEVTDYELSQNGIDLSPEGMVISAGSTYTQQVSNGQSVLVDVPYPYVSETAPVDITIYVCDYTYYDQRLAKDSCSVVMDLGE